MAPAYATHGPAGRAARYSSAMGVGDGWVELGDRFFVRRYAFYDQNIGVVLGDGEALVIDTRSTFVQAREILADLRELTRDPVTIVVDTHGHFDHAYGNHVFRPAVIWGHRRCVDFIERTGEARRARIAADEPTLAADLAEVVIDPPDHTFEERVTFELGGREIELSFLGRGHTDHDIVITVPGTDVVWAGDLLENGAVPFFGDGFPLDWPATVAAMLPLIGDGIVVPGHGDHAGVAFARSQAEGFATLASLARRVHARRARPRGRTPRADDLRRPPRGRPARTAAPRPRPDPRRALSERQSPIRTTQRPRACPATMPSRAGSSVSEGHLGAVDPEVPRSQIRGEAVPQPPASLDRDEDRIHAQQRDAAQDEREDGRVELRPAGVAAGRDGRPGLHRAEHVRQCRRADRVHGPRPAFRLERAALGRHLVAGQDPGRPERAQAVGLVGLAGRGPDLVAAVGQDRRGPCRPPRRSPRSPGPARRPGERPRSSSATTDIAAVKPAVPIAIASRGVSPGSSGTTQPAGTRWYSLYPPWRDTPRS